MFTILINELPIPVLDITIDHKESAQPLVIFQTTVRADHGTCKIQYNQITLAIGTVTLLKSGASIYTFQLQYTNPTTVPLHYNQAIQIDHRKYYFASQLKTLNYNLYNGNEYTADITPQGGYTIQQSECFAIQRSSLPECRVGANINITADWIYDSTNYISLINKEIPTQIPFALVKNWPQPNQIINSCLRVAHSALDCIKIHTTQYSESLRNFFMTFDAKLILEWACRCIIQESITARIGNGDTQDQNYNFRINLSRAPPWQANYTYNLNDRVFFDKVTWKCIAAHKSEEFDTKSWQPDHYAQHYFTTPEGHQVIEYILNCVAGDIIAHSRTEITQAKLHISKIALFKIGDSLSINNHHGVITRIQADAQCVHITIKSCPKRIYPVASQITPGAFVAGYADPEYTQAEQKIIGTHTGLQISMPTPTVDNIANLIIHNPKFTQSATHESVEIIWPEHTIQQNINHASITTSINSH